MRPVEDRPPASTMDAIALLEADHAAVHELFDLYKSAASSTQRMELIQRLCTELVVHMAVEEELFYPAVQQVDSDSLVADANAEHGEIKELITRIQKARSMDQHTDTQVRMLAEVVRHHVTEERDVLFPQVRLTDINLMALGAAIAQRQEQLLSVGNAQ